ncbi:MAG TPA: DUF6544 family protein [Chitinophagales bacterium]|nr:DUF6544 family protein [Chitinophagales bacterium]
MFKLFKSEVQRELFKHPPSRQGVFTEQDIAPLPLPVQRYFRVCNWLGKPKMTNASIRIADMQLKMDLDNDFMPVKSFQFNSVTEPVRLAYLKATMFGMLPFSGRDKYQDGVGHMYIKLVNAIPVVDLKGNEMNKAALATTLAETFLAPNYALQPYVEWTAVDETTAKATLTHHGISVSGVFHFNEAGEFTRFETNDRYMTRKDGSMKQTKWIAAVENYEERNGVRIATTMTAWWETENGLKQYAKMKIADVKFDVTAVDEVIDFK